MTLTTESNHYVQEIRQSDADKLNMYLKPKEPPVKKRCVEITSCVRCAKFTATVNEAKVDVCGHSATEGRVIKDRTEIPIWCPMISVSKPTSERHPEMTVIQVPGQIPKRMPDCSFELEVQAETGHDKSLMERMVALDVSPFDMLFNNCRIMSRDKPEDGVVKYHIVHEFSEIKDKNE